MVKAMPLNSVEVVNQHLPYGAAWTLINWGIWGHLGVLGPPKLINIGADRQECSFSDHVCHVSTSRTHA